MGENSFNAMITLLDYSRDRSGTFNFNQLESVKANEEKRINLSILVCVEHSLKESKELNLVLTYVNGKEDDGSINIAVLGLKTFKVAESDKEIGSGFKRFEHEIPLKFCNRETYKFNLRNIPIAEAGVYAVILTDVKKEEIFKEPKLTSKRQLSCYVFEVTI